MSRALIIFGIVLIAIGLLWPLIAKLGLGGLPGDIVIERANFTTLHSDRNFAPDQHRHLGAALVIEQITMRRPLLIVDGPSSHTGTTRSKTIPRRGTKGAGADPGFCELLATLLQPLRAIAISVQSRRAHDRSRLPCRGPRGRRPPPTSRASRSGLRRRWSSRRPLSLRPAMPHVVPERVHRLVGMQLAQSVGPALLRAGADMRRGSRGCSSASLS